MKKIFLSLLILISLVGVTGCSSDKDASSKYNINITSPENIDVKTYLSYNKESLIVYMTNNNSYNIGNFETKAIYYDKDGNEISDDFTTSFDFKSGSDYVVTLSLPMDSDYNCYVPEKTHLNIEIDQYYQKQVDDIPLYNDKISTSYKKIEDEIEVTINNNSDRDLSNVELVVLFMKNNQPIAADKISSSVDSNDSEIENVDIPIDWEKSEDSDKDVLINYDSIKLIVNRAIEE